MKKLILVLAVFVFTCVGFQDNAHGLEDKIIPGTRIDKVLKSKNGVHIKRCGVRIVSGQATGLYKIVIGDINEMRKIFRDSIVLGFAGTLMFPDKFSNNWDIIKYRHKERMGESLKDRKLLDKTIQKKDLPSPLNVIPNDLFGFIEYSVIYKDGEVTIIYMISKTSLDDVDKLFEFVVKYKGN